MLNRTAPGELSENQFMLPEYPHTCFQQDSEVCVGFHRPRFNWKWFEIMGFVAHGNIFAIRVGVAVLSHTVEPLVLVSFWIEGENNGVDDADRIL